MSLMLVKHGADGAGRHRFTVSRTQYDHRGGRLPPTKVASGTVVGDQVHIAWWSHRPLYPRELEQMGQILNDVAALARGTSGRRPDPRGPTTGGTPGAGGLPGDEGGPPADSVAEG